MKRRETKPETPLLVPPTIGEVSLRKWEEFFARIEAEKSGRKRR